MWLLTRRTLQGDTPLHCAAMWGERDIVQLLLDNKAEVDAKDKKDKTPLVRWAMSETKRKEDQSDLEVGDLLISRGASPKLVTKLDLSSHSLSNLAPEKFIIPFSALKRIDVQNNQLQAIPEEILKLQHLKVLQVWGNPLETIPQSFRMWPKLKEYLVTIQKKATCWRERKLLFVGQEATGKTTLVRCYRSTVHCSINHSLVSWWYSYGASARRSTRSTRARTSVPMACTYKEAWPSQRRRRSRSAPGTSVARRCSIRRISSSSPRTRTTLWCSTSPIPTCHASTTGCEC